MKTFIATKYKPKFQRNGEDFQKQFISDDAFNNFMSLKICKIKFRDI